MKNAQTLRQLFVENGMNKGWATRRANQAAKAGTCMSMPLFGV